MSSEIAQLKARLAELEANQLAERKTAVWALVDHLSREDKILLRDSLNENIRATYDSDDE